MPTTRRQTKRQTTLSFDPLLSPSSSADVKSSGDTHLRRAAAVVIEGSPRKRRKPAGTPPSNSQTSSSIQPGLSSSPPVALDSVQVDRLPSSFMTRGRRVRQMQLQSSPPPRAPPSTSKLLDMFDDSESDVGPVTPAQKGSRLESAKEHSKTESFLQIEEDQGDVGDERVQRPIRRVLQRPSRSRIFSNEEQQDLQEDLDFLKESTPDSPRPLVASQVSEKKQAKKAALDALKQKRSAVKGSEGGITAAQPPEPNSIDMQSDDGLQKHVSNSSIGTKDDEDDFVVEDDAAEDSNVQIPLEFKLRAMKPAQLFKIVVEWMCQKRLNPGFDATADTYAIAFHRLDDYVRGMGGSKFQSSAWTRSFLRSLRARPSLHEQHFSYDGLHDRCEACNRTGHPATFVVQFMGKSYDSHSLEDLSEDEDEGIHSMMGADTIPSEGRKYYVGRHCMSNARIAHSLAHWKYHLNAWVNEHLESQEYLTPAKVLERDKWSTRKRQDYADNVVDSMEESGEVRALWRDFKTEIENAQNFIDEHRRGTASSP